jgi:hypothetical protein
LRSATAEEGWRIIRMSWNEIYFGPPDVIKVDAGTQFTS